jgi:hypothetical protein
VQKAHILAVLFGGVRHNSEDIYLSPLHTAEDFAGNRMGVLQKVKTASL